MRNGFYSIADEMIAALIRASYSTNIKDQPGHVWSDLHRLRGRGRRGAERDRHSAASWDDALRRPDRHGAVPVRRAWSQATRVALNTPYPAGPGHLNDLALISPVFYEGELIAITANQAHHVDMGGFAPGSMPFGVTEIFQEGLQIPTVRLFRNGTARPRSVGDLISQNVRPRTEVRGDLLAQYAANNVAERRLTDLASRYGPVTW